METCRKNFINVYQISPKRLRVVQQKLFENNKQYGIDMRGFHNNRPNRLSEDIKMTIKEHKFISHLLISLQKKRGGSVKAILTP